MPFLTAGKSISSYIYRDIDGDIFYPKSPTTWEDNFGAGVDGFTDAFQLSAAGGKTIGGRPNCLVLTCGAGAVAHQAKNPAWDFGDQTITISFEVFIPSTNSNADQLSLIHSTGTQLTYTGITPDTWETKTNTILIAAGRVDFGFRMLDGGVAGFTDPGEDDIIAIRNLKIARS